MEDKIPSIASEPEVVRQLTVETPRSNNFIEITEEGETFPWQYTDDSGVRWDSQFTLQVIPDSLDKKWRRELTKREWDKGQAVEKLDTDEYVKRCLGNGIVAWTNVMHRGQPIPCELKNKLLLPERLKTAIMRAVVGKEGGLAVAQARSEEKKA